MKIINKILLGASTVALLCSSSVGAQATEGLDASALGQFRANMAQAGIDAATQESLVAKLQAHQPLDSMLDVAPVASFTEEHATAVRTVNVFSDGSRSWTETQVAPAASAGVSSRAAVTRCGASGAWRVNCRVDISDLVSSAFFVVDYKAAATSEVRDFRGAGCTIIGGSCSVNGKIGRATQSSAGPAWAYLNYNANALGWIGASGQFGIRVSSGSVSTY